MAPALTEKIDCRTARAIEAGKYYIHQNAQFDSCSEGCCGAYSCPDCGTAWAA